MKSKRGKKRGSSFDSVFLSSRGSNRPKLQREEAKEFKYRKMRLKWQNEMIEGQKAKRENAAPSFRPSSPSGLLRWPEIL